jgi:hypothetical protein
MSTLPPILLASAAGVLAALALWIWLAQRLAARIRSRLRAVPLCLPLLLIPAVYGLFWLAFFSSPSMAVQAHAIRLTLQHAVAPFLPWIAGGWLVVALAALWPLLKDRPAKAI